MYNVKERAIGRKDVACTSEPGFTGVEKNERRSLGCSCKKPKTKLTPQWYEPHFISDVQAFKYRKETTKKTSATIYMS